MTRQTKENAYAYSYHVNYIRNARAIAIAWGIFTLCFAIIMVILLLEPYWLQAQSDSLGSFGLYSYQKRTGSLISAPERNNYLFSGDNLPSVQIVASWFVIAALTAIGLSIIVTVLFLCKIPTARVFTIAGVLQILAGICLFLGVVLFPKSFDSNVDMRNACPGIKAYRPGDNCFYSWAFYLAIVGILDALALGILALILARKQEKLQADITYSDYARPNGRTNYGTGHSNSLFEAESVGKASSHRNGGGSISRRSYISETGVDAARSIGDQDYATVTPKSQRASQYGSQRGSQLGSQRSRGNDGDDEASVVSHNSAKRSTASSKPHVVVT